MVKKTLLQIRMTEDEKDLLKDAAAKLDMSMSEFVRTNAVLISRAVDDSSTGEVDVESVTKILNYNNVSVLKSTTDED